MPIQLPNLGKRLDELGGEVGRFFGGVGSAIQKTQIPGLQNYNVGNAYNDLIQKPVVNPVLRGGQVLTQMQNNSINKRPTFQNVNLREFGSDIATTGLNFGTLGLGRTLLTAKPVVNKIIQGGVEGSLLGGAQGGVETFRNQGNFQDYGRNIATGAALGGTLGAAAPIVGQGVRTAARVTLKAPQRIATAYRNNPVLSSEGGYINPSASVANYRPSPIGRIEDVSVQVNELKGAIAGKQLAFQEAKRNIEMSSATPKQKMQQLRQLETQISGEVNTLQRELGGWQEHLSELGGGVGKPLTNPSMRTVQPKTGILDRVRSSLKDESGFLGLPTRPKPQVKSRQSGQSPENLSYISTETGPQPLLPKSVARPVSLVDKAFRSTRSVIERQGETGKQLAGMLRKSRDAEELYLAQVQKATPSVHALKKDKDFENFIDAVEGKAQPANDRIAKAVAEWKAVAPTIRERAIQAGLDVGDLGPNYYPHFVDLEGLFKNRSAFNEAVNHLVQSGQAKDTAEAIKALGYARDVSRNRRFGNLEASRMVDLPMFDKTPGSLSKYLQGSARRIAQTETFGAKDEKALDLIARAGEEGFDTEAMKSAYDVAVGARKYSPDAQRISGNVRKYMTTTRLGLSALSNVSQSVNTGIVTGHFRTMGAMLKQLDPKTRSYVVDTGVIANAVIDDLKRQAGFEGLNASRKPIVKLAKKTVNKLTAPAFSHVEKFNRSVAATAGRDYALRLAQKGDEATLRKLGVEGPITGKTLTPQQQVQASRGIVEKTQFKTDPQDLPGWADSPGGKMVAQFRTFSYNQSKFFSNEVLKPMLKGNYLPAARLLAALPLGYALYETKRNIAGRPEEKSEPRIALESFGNIGGAGLAMDIFRGINPLNGKYIDPARRVSMAVGTVGGPTVGLAADVVGGVSEAVQRKNVSEQGLKGKVTVGQTDEKYTDVTPLARTALRQIPIAGTPLQNRILPYNSEKPAVALFPTASAATEPVTKQNVSGKLSGDNTTSEFKTVQKAKREANKAGVASGERLGGTVELDAAQKRIDRAKENFPDKLSDNSKTVLTRYAKLNENGREKFHSDPKNSFNLKVAQYERDRLGGKMTKLEDYRAQQSIARLKITSGFDKDAVDLHGLSKAALRQYFEANPDQQRLFAKVVALDKALTQAGVQEKDKFSGGLGKGRKGSVVANRPVSFSSGSFKRPTVSTRKASRRSRVSKNKVSSAVSLKKSQV